MMLNGQPLFLFMTRSFRRHKSIEEQHSAYPSFYTYSMIETSCVCCVRAKPAPRLLTKFSHIMRFCEHIVGIMVSPSQPTQRKKESQRCKHHWKISMTTDYHLTSLQYFRKPNESKGSAIRETLKRPRNGSMDDTAKLLTREKGQSPIHGNLVTAESQNKHNLNVDHQQPRGMQHIRPKNPTTRKRPEVVMIRGPASATKSTSVISTDDKHPEEVLKSIIESNGYSGEPIPYSSLDGFFLQTTEAHMAGYTSEVVKSIRDGNIAELRKVLAAGQTLQCCNRFGESIIHMACRRGDFKVVSFLVEEAKVSVRIHDDYGRTPLSDACWTGDTEFSVIELLMRECPELFLVKDKRGHTPLSYARRDHWAEWCDFLERHRHLLHPRALCQARNNR